MRQGLFLMVFGLVLGTALSPGRSDGPPIPQRPPAGKTPSSAKGWLEKAESGYYVQVPAVAESLDDESSVVLQVTPTGPLLIPAGPIWSVAPPAAAERIKLPIRLADHYGPVPQTTRASTPENKTAEWNEPAEGTIRGANQYGRLSFGASAGYGISVATAETEEAKCPVSSCCRQGLLPVWMQPLLACLNDPNESAACACAANGCPLARAASGRTTLAAKDCNCTSTCQCGDSCCCKDGVRCSITCTCKACECNVNCQCGATCKCTSTSRCSARCLCGGNSLATDFAQSVCVDPQGKVSCRVVEGGNACCSSESSLPRIGKYCHAETKNGNYFGRLKSFTPTWVVLLDPHNQSRQWIPTASLQCLTEMADSPESLPSGDESEDTSNEVVATPLPNRATCVPLALPIEAGQIVSPASVSCFLEDDAPHVTIPRGMRLYSSDFANSSVAQISPGDRIDLLLLALPHPGPQAPPCLSRIFAENVQVAALAPSNCMEATTVSLLVSKDQCELIALANAVGVVSICKRSPDDSSDSSENSGDHRQAATIQKLLGIAEPPGPGNCAVPVFGVSPWGPMVQPPVANWGPMPQAPEGFAQPGYSGAPGGRYFPADAPGFGPPCPLPSRMPQPTPYGFSPYSDPMEAAVPPPSLNGPPAPVPASTWAPATPTYPSTTAVPPTPFPVPKTYPSAPAPQISDYLETESEDATPPGLTPKSSPIPPAGPSTMPTHNKATSPVAPKSAQLPPPSSYAPFVCQLRDEDPELAEFSFSEEWKELTNRRSKLLSEVAATGGNVAALAMPQGREPSLSGLTGGKVAMPVRTEQLASYNVPGETAIPAAKKPLYRIDCQIEVQQADGQRAQLSAPRIVTPAESSLALGEARFKFRVEPAHDGKIQLTVCDPQGFCHVTPLRDGQSICLPWAIENGPRSGTIRIGVGRADAALKGLLSAASHASDVAAKLSLAARQDDEPSAIGEEDYQVRVYPIADLIEQTQVAPPLLAKGEQGAASLTDSSNVAARVDDLLEKIHSAAPQGWDGQGGSGHAEYYPAKRALVIWQTAANHSRIGGLLQVLRDADQLARGERAGTSAASVSERLRAQ